ncbi:MAG TPA: hypothetical protein VG498_02805 [Terriglobales bacterium]|nr:hypothetical protein [Terriglobales bacterium]
MKVRYLLSNFLLAAGLTVVLFMNPACVAAQDRSAINELETRPVHEPPLMGIHWAREFAHTARPHRSPNMIWHSGSIMQDSAVRVIFWGTKWGSGNYVVDKVSGLSDFYQGFSKSNYAATSDEYTGTNGQVGSSNSYLGYFIDSSQASGGSQTSAILAEVCRVIPSPTSNGYYPVYTDIKRGNAGYCAWHSYGTCGGIPVQFAFFFDLDNDPGCDPQDTKTNHSQGLAALANVSAHELSEARTDPRNGGWYDAQGNENGDKCAWTFNVPYVTFSNGSIWKVQGEWSNAAYNAGLGYPNNSGQRGCLDGH